MTALVPELEITFELEITKGRSFMEFVVLFDRLSKFGRTVTINAGTKDVKVYDHDGRMICWISGAVRNRYVVYDVEEVTTADRKAIDAYAGLPTGKSKEDEDD